MSALTEVPPTTEEKVEIVPKTLIPPTEVDTQEQEGQCSAGQVVVSSRKVAEDFGKEHKNVLQGIEKLQTEISSAENSALLFIPAEYTASNGKANKEYLLTRDGFTLTVMGFTGKKALQWKLKYIEVLRRTAFNRMEKELQDRKSNSGGNNSILDVIYRNLQSQLVSVQM